MNYGKIEKIIRDNGDGLVESVSLVNVYQKESAVNYTVRIKFRSMERTLEGPEVDSIVEKIKCVIAQNVSIPKPGPVSPLTSTESAMPANGPKRKKPSTGTKSGFICNLYATILRPIGSMFLSLVLEERTEAM